MDYEVDDNRIRIHDNWKNPRVTNVVTLIIFFLSSRKLHKQENLSSSIRKKSLESENYRKKMERGRKGGVSLRFLANGRRIGGAQEVAALNQRLAKEIASGN